MDAERNVRAVGDYNSQQAKIFLSVLPIFLAEIITASCILSRNTTSTSTIVLFQIVEQCGLWRKASDIPGNASPRIAGGIKVS